MVSRKKTNISTHTKGALRNRLRRLRETSDEREQRLARNRERSKAIRARETSAERSLRLAQARVYWRNIRERMRKRIPQEHQKHLKQEGVLKTKKPRGRKPRAQQAQRNALVESSANASVVYKPTLWYYKHLNFLSGNKDADSNDSDSDNNDDTVYVQTPRGRKRTASTSIGQEGDPETYVDPSAAAFGRSVGAQLHQLSKMQRCIAEKLISDVIYYAKMDQLSLDTCINMKESSDVELLIPEAGPSWYDTDTATCEQEPTSSTVVTAEELARQEIAETESAVSFIKMEANDTENYVFHDVDEGHAIDIVKQELL